MKVILITGINGFLGSSLAKYLNKENKVIGLEYSKDNLFRLNGYKFKVYGVNSTPLSRIFEDQKIDFIIHTATVYGHDQNNFENMINTNVLLPLKLYTIASEYRVKAFLNTDTFFNNKEFDYSYLADYTLTKKQCLDWLKLKINKTKLLNLKVFHMYGPGDSQNKFVTKLFTELKNNKKEINLTLGEQKRDFIYIEDVVNAYNCIICKVDLIKTNFVEFEIGHGRTTSIMEFVETAKEVIGSNSKLLFGTIGYRKGEIFESRADTLSLINLGCKIPELNLKNDLLKFYKQL